MSIREWYQWHVLREAFLQTDGCVKNGKPGEFKLSSGILSDFYVDSRKVILSAEGHFLVAQLIWDLLQEGPPVKAVSGMSMGADPLISAVVTYSASKRGTIYDAIYVRKEPKGHGMGRQTEAPKCAAQGSPVAVLEDVVTTGDSTIKAIEALRRDGFNPVRVITITDRGEANGKANILKYVDHFESIFTRDDLRKT